MRRLGWMRAVVAAAAVGASAVGAVGAHPAQRAAAATSCPWMNRHLSADERATELVKAMTLDQEIGELYGRGDFTHYGAANEIPAIPALCVPELVFNDAGAGIGDGQTLVTAFPDGITQAASWSRGLQYRLGQALGWEAWHKGVNVQLAPGVDIARNPLNGRNFEYAGEDPYLAGQTAAAEIQGIQSQHVAATVKHYALNDQETNRMTDSSDADERTMQEIDLPAFDTAVHQGHVASVMCSYNRINGVYGCENRYLLDHVLKGQFGFKGWVMSDWGATHSTVKAANNGLDQEQNVTAGTYFSDALKQAVLAGKVSKTRIDDMVHRLMRALFAVGAFDDPPPADPQAYVADVNTPQEKAVALEAAEGGAVLLKNARRVLPLRGTGRRIAVIGRPASPAGAQDFYQGGGSSRVPIVGPNPDVVDPLSALTTRAEADGDTVTYTPGTATADAVAAASAADVAVVFIGDSESEGSDRSSLSAVDGGTTSTGTDQNALVSAVAAANPRTIVVVQAGGPVAMPWLGQVRGVLDMWYPGEQDGNAAAALLFGDVDPSGKLPFTFPRSMQQTPIRSARQWPGVADAHGVPHSVYSERLLVGYRWYDAKGIRPLFPFGFGLSYTTFRFAHLAVRPAGGGVWVRLDVTNTGSRAGSQVAQVYVCDPPAAHEPPKQLKGYRKVYLRPGQTRTVRIFLDRRAFAHWSTKVHAWRVTAGRYTIRAGGSSAQLPLHATVLRGAAPA